MRDLAALLTSLTNVTRAQLLAVLRSEAEIAEQLASTSLSRTAKQRARQGEARERLVRLQHAIAYFQNGAVPADMAQPDRMICQALDQRLQP
jgi:hypothetical protein